MKGIVSSPINTPASAFREGHGEAWKEENKPPKAAFRVWKITYCHRYAKISLLTFTVRRKRPQTLGKITGTKLRVLVDGYYSWRRGSFTHGEGRECARSSPASRGGQKLRSRFIIEAVNTWNEPSPSNHSKCWEQAIVEHRRHLSTNKAAKVKHGTGVKRIKTPWHMDPWNNMSEHITIETISSLVIIINHSKLPVQPSF